MKLSLGFSPCPNDTFIFDALVNGKIDTGEYKFEPVLEDIQTLNQWAKEGRLDITKLSFPAYFENEDNYQMLDSGAALGKGVGPLLIAKKMVNVPDIEHSRIAIPGLNTTANFLLSFAFPMSKNKIPMLFSEIEEAVLMGKVDMGVIIHENRFTYQQKGLIKVCDLGQIWEERQKAPIPLACIAMKKMIDGRGSVSERSESEVPRFANRETGPERSHSEVPRFARDDGRAKEISKLIKKSIEYAFEHYPSISDYTKAHAQEMDENVMRQHIELYVNNYSLDMAEGKDAVEQLRGVYEKQQAVSSEQ